MRARWLESQRMSVIVKKAKAELDEIRIPAGRRSV
jgi:hypothetical protein